MRSLVLVAFLLSLIIPTHARAVCDGPPVALDKSTSEDLAIGIIVSGDTLILRPATNARNAFILGPVEGSEVDLCVTVNVRVDEQSRSAAGGIEFWRAGQGTHEDFYAFEIDSGGNASVGRLEDRTWIDIVKWGRLTFLNKGLNVRNELRVSTSGDTAKLYANGRLFKTVTREPGRKRGYVTALMATADKGAAQFDFSDVRSSTQTALTSKGESGEKDRTPVPPSDDTQKNGASANTGSALDAAGQGIFNRLLNTKPDADQLTKLGISLLQVKSGQSPQPAHGQAQIGYELKSPADGGITSLSFFIYPDTRAASRYFDMSDFKGSFVVDLPSDSFMFATIGPFGPLDKPTDVLFGVVASERRAWAMSRLQVGRVVVLAMVGERVTGEAASYQVSDLAIRRSSQLLALGVLQLEEAKIGKDEPSTQSEPPRRTGVEATPGATGIH